MSVGIVHADGGLRIRSGPSTNNTIVGSIPNGASVRIIGGDSQWWRVSYNGATGYSHSNYIDVRGKVTARSGLNMRSGPETNNRVVSAIPYNTQITIKRRESNSWFYVSYNGTTGYSASEYISLEEVQNEERRQITQPRHSENCENMGQKIVNYARSRLGCPYVYGGNGPNSFDCSGLVQWVYRQVNIDTPRVVSGQATFGTSGDGSPGDVVIFGNDRFHSGICIGNGECIHAPRPGRDVRIVKMCYISDVYFFRRFY